MQIGPYKLDVPLILAPMAGVTDQPFRKLCLQMGAGLAVSEMLSANPDVWQSEKSRLRMVHDQEAGVRAVQIAGSEPQLMADAARFNVENGAQVIDINMGCPAKKVNKKLAGSALLQFPDLVEDILKAVVAAVDVPVTLKIRTGWDPENRNGVAIAKLAERCGIQSLAVHGRTRACMFKGDAEFETIRAIKRAVDMPVVANGDITSVEKAQWVLKHTGADAIMIGRGAQGRPWLFRETAHFLETGRHLPAPSIGEQASILREHVEALHGFYGDFKGAQIARKHVGWYLASHDEGGEFRRAFYALTDAQSQLDALARYFRSL
ncbi:MAG: tRNA dihydrouridine synthase DusB [Pseudomonadota bacterium]|uniref:tRNA dihydrouridine synthase DusB n=1 Tax=Gallaecimonas pentaromativorans TaxID=584787 RepID=UPI00067F5219|nr:tRNA dihydrouridine synthase DusB [Gallaecimonas pentaromativorans]MED5524903.1 tRNA dihydrouridine synthase DusB [Pseudomonadota bacterium]